MAADSNHLGEAAASSLGSKGAVGELYTAAEKLPFGILREMGIVVDERIRGPGKCWAADNSMRREVMAEAACMRWSGERKGGRIHHGGRY